MRFVYVTAKPRIVILAPRSRAKITSTTVSVEGRVPLGSSIVVRNRTNGSGSAVTADPAGAFSAAITLDRGTNDVLVEVTDRAGNRNSATLSVVRSRV